MKSIPSAIHNALSYKLVTVHLTNGLCLVGRVVLFDPLTMNLQLDSITSSELRNPATGIVVGSSPPQLMALQSVSIRGTSVQFIDVLNSSVADGVTQAVAQAVAAMRPV